MSLFGFVQDTENYEQRKVAKDEFPWGMISTARVSDGVQPYETGIKHQDYNEGNWIIVEAYDAQKQAQEGHLKWIDIMANPPDFLTDCANAEIADLFLGKERYRRNQK